MSVRRSRQRWCVAALAAALALAPLPGPARADPGPSGDALDAPDDATEGEDYVADVDDALDDGDVEVGVSAEGRAGGTVTQRRRVRLSDDGLDGTWREGRGDPLGGGALAHPLGDARVSVGRMRPRWGRGVALGGAREPWRQSDGADAGAARPVAGPGVWLRPGSAGIEALAGRLDKQQTAGLRVRRGPAAIGVLGTRRSHALGSITLDGGDTDLELAGDGRGRWGAELGHARPIGDDAWLRLRARGGSAGFRAAGVRTPGPTQALALEADGPILAAFTAAGAPIRAHVLGAWWRWQAGRAGARLALAAQREMAHHAAVALGFEEQQGPRREVGGRASGVRQGLWCEWRGSAAPVTLSARHEVFGTRSFARDAVRVASSVQMEAPLAAGLALRLAHTVYRARRGESLYLPEPASDRVVLRALSGDGERTRLELDAPIAGGQMRAGLTWNDKRGVDTRPRWSLEWARRARARRAMPDPEEER